MQYFLREGEATFRTEEEGVESPSYTLNAVFVVIRD